MILKPLHRLTLIFCLYFCVMFTIISVILKSICTNNNMIGKYIVLSNIISVVSDSILRICIQEPLLILKKNIVLFHILSAYNSLLVRYKVYSSNPREYLCPKAEGIVKPMKTLVLISTMSKESCKK